MMVMIAVITHTITNQPALPTFLTMSALTMNIPDPIMEPATTMVASSNPKLGLNEDSCDMRFFIYRKIKEKPII
jgi:hypothetical protein